MQPTRELWRRGPDLLAADAMTLAPVADACRVHLISASFVPSLDLTIAALTPSPFDGGQPKEAGLGAQPIYYDALDGMLTIRIKEPVGGWNWECTLDPVAPVTIYGVFLTNQDDDELYGSMLLPNPVVIDAADQGIGIGDITFKFKVDSPY